MGSQNYELLKKNPDASYYGNPVVAEQTTEFTFMQRNAGGMITDLKYIYKFVQFMLHISHNII